MHVDILNQLYSVSVRTEDDLEPTVLAKDYAFRMDNFHDSIAYFSTKSSHTGRTGFVGISDFQLSNANEASINNFHQPINALTGDFGVKVVATPVADDLGYIGLAETEITSEQLALLGIAIKFDETGQIKVINGDTFTADSAITFTPGELHMFLIDGNIDSLEYNVKVVLPDLRVVDIAKGYKFGGSFTGSSLNYLVTSTASENQHIALDGIEAGILKYESSGNPTVSTKIDTYTKPFTKSVAVRTSHGAGMNAAFGINKNVTIGWSDFNTIFNFHATNQEINIYDESSYVPTGIKWDQGKVFLVEFAIDPTQKMYSVSIDTGIYDTAFVVAEDYSFRNQDGDTINYITSKCNWSLPGILVGGYLIMNDVAITMPGPYVNSAPTINHIADDTRVVEDGDIEIKLSGITDGDDGTQELTVTASSSNTATATVAIDYTSSDATGLATITPVDVGSTIIEIVVKDNGGTEDGGKDETIISFNINLVDVSSLEEATQPAEIDVFPNPTTDQLNIENIENFSIVEIYNSLGSKVITRELNNKEKIILDVAEIKAGTYFIKLYNTDNAFRTYKFVKK